MFPVMCSPRHPSVETPMKSPWHPARHLSAIGVVAVLGCTAPFAAAGDADVVYVTDELRLGLYRTEETSGRSLKTLVSGARLEVLERSLMSIRVRTEEGDLGWVKTAFVVDKEPARRRLARAEALQEETAAMLATREAEVSELQARLTEQRTALAKAEQGIEDLPALRAENEALQATLSASGVRVPLLWLLVAVGIAFATGIFAGYRWLDRRVRKQFGGLKIY